MGLTILGVVLGAVVAILITIGIENLRKPHLVIELIPPSDKEYEKRPARNVRFLYLKVSNKPLPTWARWMSRDAATQCHGTITFHHLDGQNVFSRAMQVRWSGSPEPTPIHVVVGDQTYLFFDPSKLAFLSRMDIYPGESESLDTVAKFDDENECYGWSNENYFTDPVWRNPNWKLTSGRYLIKVTITTSGEKISKVFRLINDVPRSDSRLEQKMENDNVYD